MPDATPPAHVSDPSTDRRRTIWGWVIYDFANSAYTTLIVTFIYAVYFTQQIAPDEITGTALWSRGVTITAVIVALLSPLVGALADRGRLRRSLLIGTTLLTVVTVSLLYTATPGRIVLALTLFVISNVAYELSGVLYNSYLPEIAGPEEIGRVSGHGWALGYLGGLLAIAVALFVFIQPEVPPFGLDPSTGAHVRATTVLVGVWFLVFSIPMFVWVREPEHPEPRPALTAVVRNAFGALRETFREVRRYRQVVRLLLARLFYNDGLVTIFAFGPIFAAGTFGFTTVEVLYWGLALNVTAGLGAFAMGYLDDWIGGRRTLFITLIGLVAASVWAVLAETKTSLYLAGLVLGIFVGPNQAASRSLLGRFIPRAKEAEFFGFYAFSGKAMAFAGPLLLGIVTQATGSQRIGMASILGFFIVGGVLLAWVDEDEGRRAA